MVAAHAEQTFIDALWRDHGGRRGMGNYAGIYHDILDTDESVHVLVRETGEDRFTEQILMLTDRRIVLVSDGLSNRWKIKTQIGAAEVLRASRVSTVLSTDRLVVDRVGGEPIRLRFSKGRSATEFIETLNRLKQTTGPIHPVMEASGALPPPPAEQSFLAAAARTLAHEPYRYRKFATIYREILSPDEQVQVVVCDSAIHSEYRLLVLTDRRLLHLTDWDMLMWSVKRHGDIPRSSIVSARFEPCDYYGALQRIVVQIEGRKKPLKMEFDSDDAAHELMSALASR